MEKNLLSLIECGKCSPGVVSIRSNPMSKTLHQFINYLNSQISSTNLSNIDIYILIRSFWALPRIGCTYKQATNNTTNALQETCRLIDVLLVKILESQSTLTPIEWSVVVKSIGKLRYGGNSDQVDQILGKWNALLRYFLDGVVKCCQSFTLSEISDVTWGLLRMSIEANQSSSSSNHSNSISDMDSSGEEMKLNFLSDNRMFTILQQIEVLITSSSFSMKHIRPYVNRDLHWLIDSNEVDLALPISCIVFLILDIPTGNPCMNIAYPPMTIIMIIL